MRKSKAEKKNDKNTGRKETKNKGKRLKKNEMENAIASTFQKHPQDIFNYKQISNIIGAENPVQKRQVAEILYNLTEADILTQVDRGRFKLKGFGTLAIGTFVRRSNGKNSFVPEEGGEPIFVSERNSAHAMNGDKVEVQIYAKRAKSVTEAEVIRIIETKERTFIGRLDMMKGYAFLITEARTLANDIFIPLDKLKGAKAGDKAVVRIIEWPEEAKNPIGEVVDVLGMAGDNNAEMHAILAEYGLPYKYPANVERAADKIPASIPEEEIARREDFRDILTFTIDPKDAKDFDDALSARRLDNGNWEVGVHIADVTHYVRPGDIIDKEAFKRATSVYLVDRTIPMLPERLCNQICSLRPNEEKLCFSAVFELDGQANIVKSHICRTVIKSDRRFTYEEAQEVIETGEGECKEAILALNELAKILRERRFKNGAVNFERSEVRFEIDEKGKPLSVYFKIAQDANKLIEEFMLLANRTVAESVGKKQDEKAKKTFVYRIHELPTPEKMDALASFIARFGYKIKTDGKKKELSTAINKLMTSVKGKPEENVIETITIRSMPRARYTTKNEGHYGLAFDFYTHFTSPIRRYPDMMVHRLIERYMDGGRSVPKEKTEELCEHCSEMEVTASNAERSSIKYKQIEFMMDKKGMVFEAIISGVAEWGIYVELTENKCEGLIPIRDLTEDYYELDDRNFCLRGRRTHREFRLGDTLNVQLAQANLERKLLDFKLVE